MNLDIFMHYFPIIWYIQHKDKIISKSQKFTKIGVSILNVVNNLQIGRAHV